MLSTLETDATTLDALDFKIRCGQPSHEQAKYGCVPGEPATRLAVAPCCGARIYVCEGRAIWMRTVATMIRCTLCGDVHPNTAYRFPRIEVS